ncbi:hypothetical protein THZG08_70136 [Vibrio owensii]|nr:hypothetical protein THZG08_70136 [Vibrio owensii]CAH1590892.1 hypothetical protein THOA03_70138 [Vibrio owensii]
MLSFFFPNSIELMNKIKGNDVQKLPLSDIYEETNSDDGLSAACQ